MLNNWFVNCQVIIQALVIVYDTLKKAWPNLLIFYYLDI